MEDVDYIDLLKLRASYGVNGNNNIDDYPLLKEAKGLNFDGDLFGAG